MRKGDTPLFKVLLWGQRNVPDWNGSGVGGMSPIYTNGSGYIHFLPQNTIFVL